MHISDLKHPDSSLSQKLDYIYSLRTGSKVNWDSEAYLSLLHDLGNPHLSLPPVIHVAGTNGKGSVVAMLRAIFEAADYKVHAYTSPHLMRVNERIVLCGEMISDVQLLCVLDEVLLHAEGKQLSFFEIITAAAFLMFSKIPADVLLLEVGMGGLLDCTNVIVSPAVSIINRISSDHTEFLGDTLSKIAAQKGGIIKPGIPCAVGYQGDSEDASVVLAVLERNAQQNGSEIFVCGRDWNVALKESVFEFITGDGHTRSFPFPSLQGMHQVYNAGLVIAALLKIQHNFQISDEHIREGLSSIHWNARLQRIKLPGIPNGYDVYLDCGHNDSAGEVLAAQALQWQKEDDFPLVLVVGMLGNKDFQGFINPILPYCKAVLCVSISGEPNAFNPAEAAEIIRRLDFSGEVLICPEISQISEMLLKMFGEPCRILIAGSVYLAGDILRHIASE